MTVSDTNKEVSMFKCEQCGGKFNLDSVTDSVISYGAIILNGRKDGYLGFICTECKEATTVLVKYESIELNKIINSLYENINERLFNNDNYTYHWVYNSFPYDFYSLKDKPVNKYMELSKHEFRTVPEAEVEAYLQDEFEYLSEGYCSYSFGATAMGPAVAIWWYRGIDIEALVEIENETKLKVFPRYIIYDPIFTRIEDLCWRDKLQLKFNESVPLNLPVTELLSSTPKKEITTNFEFLSILDTVHVKNIQSYISNDSQTVTFSSGISKLPLGQSDVLNSQQILKNKARNHEELSDGVWTNFNKDYVQDLLSKMSAKFILDYIDLSQRIDFTYHSVWKLKEEYLSKLYGAVKSRHKRKRLKKEVDDDERKRVIEAENNFPSLKKIISEDSTINDIKIKLTNTAKYLWNGSSYLLLGERGTGKGMFAKVIHEASMKTGHFIKVDCGAVVETLFESELFGHKKGSFSGAHTDKKGAFELADGGTIFIDEVGNLPLSLQPKLLGVLQDEEFQPVGASQSEKVNAIIVLATNKDLDQMCKDDEFLPDLYDRFKRPSILIPPLRERKDDILLLVEHFIEIHDIAHHENSELLPIQVSQECIEALKNYEWKGNVRDLESIIKEILLSRAGDENRDEITISDLPPEILHKNEVAPNKSKNPKILPGNTKITNEKIVYWMKELNNNKTKVAAKLGVTYHTILRRCKKISL